VKQTLQIIFCCLFGFIHSTYAGNGGYVVQIAASKNPTNIKWFSEKHQIDQKILEIKESGWYKYVIGQFENSRAASEYIATSLQHKGLQGPFPRILSDSLRKSSEKEINPDKTATIDKKEDFIPKETVSTFLENTSTVKTFTLQSAGKPDQGKLNPLEKYKIWERLIGWENLQKLEIKLIERTKSILPQSFVPFYIRMIDKAIRYPVILFFLMLIVLFILNAILIMAILEISNTLKNQIERYNELYQTMYERALTGFLFQEFDLETAVSRLKKINLQRNRKIFVSVLFNFQKNLSGDSDQKILEIFYRLQLNEDAVKKINSNTYYQQILGLRELTNLYPSGAFSIVESHINDKNDALRAEAQTSYVRLNQKEPFNFIIKLRKPFTRWTQLTAFYIFRLHKIPAPSFAVFLKSDLYNVQNFSLRMITFFQQKENPEDIMKLLHATRKLTRYLAIKAISDLRILEAKPLLKEMFGKESYRNQVEIVKAMQHIGDTGDFDFLENIIWGKDVTLKLEACRSMYFMSSSGVENIVRLNDEKELNLQAYIAHIDDNRN
jgi:hypothetical protein